MEASITDCLYRIARHTGSIANVLYVEVHDASMPPDTSPEQRTWIPAILRHLRGQTSSSGRP